MEESVEGFLVWLEPDGKRHEGDFVVHVHHGDAMEVLGAELMSKAAQKPPRPAAIC